MVKNRFVCSKENLRNRGYTEEEIYNICQTPVMTDFWLKKGYTEEESEKLIRENQKYASQFVDFDNRLLPSNKEYWIKRGYSEKDSMVKVSNSQRTFSKDICIEKYGKERGLEVFNRRQIKWRESLNKGGNLKIGYSKISQELFDILNEMVVDNKHFRYATNGGEYKISRKEGGVWMYDFVCLDRNKIIEYQGDMYHANPKIYEEHEYPHPFRKNKTSKEIWDHDKKKKMRANEEGFEVLYIWDSEFRRVSSDRKKKIIQKCINFLSK